MPGLALFDYAGSFQNGFDKAKQEKQRNGLAGLAADYAQGGAPDYQGIAANGGDPLAFRNDQQKQQDMQEKQIGQLAGLLASIRDPVARNAAYQQNKQRITAFAQSRGFPVPENVDDSHLPELQYIAQAWGGIGSQNDQLPAEARTALFFQQHPDLAVQEAERYKNRPFYDSSTGQLVYPKGAPNAQAPGPAVAPDAGDPANDPTMPFTNFIATQAQAMRKAGVPTEQIDQWVMQAQQSMPPMPAAPNAGAAPPARPMPAAPVAAGPGVVQIGPTAGEKVRQQEQAKIDTQVGNSGRVAGAEADVSRAKAQAEADVKRGADLREAMPKARMALSAAKIKAQNVNRAIDMAIPKINVWTAGTVGRPLSSLGGTEAANLRANIDTLEANLAFNELQSMRASSPTGGALGSITEKELELLGSTIASLKQSQSPTQLKQNLAFVKLQYAKVVKQMEEDFKTDYAGVAPAPGNSAPPPNSGGKRIKFNPATGEFN